MSSLFCETYERHASHRTFIAQIAKNIASELPDVAFPRLPRLHLVRLPSTALLGWKGSGQTSLFLLDGAFSYQAGGI